MQNNTKISYLYRDACNYKKLNIVVVNGMLTEEQKNSILDTLDCGEFFIPAQIGLPEERFEKLTESDHCWFELDESSFEETDRPATVAITTDELTKRFIAAKGKWDDIQYAK